MAMPLTSQFSLLYILFSSFLAAHSVSSNSGASKQLSRKNKYCKRKSANQSQVTVDPNTGNETQVTDQLNTDLDEEYFQNGRIYEDWDDLDWMGEECTNLYEGDAVWAGASSSSAINLNANPESYNLHHLDDF
jgi:hypothetical protein